MNGIGSTTGSQSSGQETSHGLERLISRSLLSGSLRILSSREFLIQSSQWSHFGRCVHCERKLTRLLNQLNTTLIGLESLSTTCIEPSSQPLSKPQSTVGLGLST